jgi:excisionase family DNA binding protein
LSDDVVSPSPIVAALLAELDDEALAVFADRLAPLLASRLNGRDEGWLNAEGAARYLACSRGRLYDLVQLGKLKPRWDGRRLLFRRADLDRYLEDWG